MKMKFTNRRQKAKKATILASKQVVEDALKYGQIFLDRWQREEDPRLEQLQGEIDLLSSVLNKNPQQMTQDGVTTVEEYFDDAIKPDVANRVKQAVDQIAAWRSETRPGSMQQTTGPVVPQAPTPAMASAKKKATCGGAAFVTDRDETGEAKAPEKLEVPRLAADKKAQAPAAAPAAPAPAAVPAPIPENGTFDISTLSTEALAKAIKALVSIKEFEEDKSAQALIEEMTAELKTRPIEQEEPKAAPAAAAPAAAPVAPAPVAAPVASAKKADNPVQAQVSLGGLNTAPAEPSAEPITASESKVAVTPPGISEETMHELKEKERKGEIDSAYAVAWDIHNKMSSEGKIAVTPPSISEELMHELKEQYPGEPEKAYGTAWKIHKEKEGSLKEVFAALDKAANAQGGSWFVGGGKPAEVTEDGGRTPEIGEAHSKLEDKTGIDRPATTAPITLNKQAAEMTTSKAVKESEKYGNELKKLYLEAKSLTNVNDTRPVREAVEAIFRAADLFNEATKVFNKQQMQEEAEEAAAKIKEENKGKKSALASPKCSKCSTEMKKDGGQFVCPKCGHTRELGFRALPDDKKSSFGGLAIAAGE